MKYGEGDVVTIPLPSGGLAVGLVARKGPDGDLLMYFFGPRLDCAPEVIPERVVAHNACAVWRTSDGGIVEGRWERVGTLSGFQRKHWPMPPYTRTCDITNRKSIVHFREDDPFEVESERLATDEEVEGVERAGLKFRGAVEKGLDRLL